MIGPNAYSQAALYGNYHGDSDEYITNLDGIRRAVGDKIRIFYSQGCHLYIAADDPLVPAGKTSGRGGGRGKEFGCGHSVRGSG